jgi:hypothetical protein
MCYRILYYNLVVHVGKHLGEPTYVYNFVYINKNIKFLYMTCQVRRLGGGVYVVQASWNMEDHGSIRRVSLGGR